MYLFYGSFAIVLWKCGAQLLAEANYKGIKEEDDSKKKIKQTKGSKYQQKLYWIYWAGQRQDILEIWMFNPIWTGVWESILVPLWFWCLGTLIRLTHNHIYTINQNPKFQNSNLKTLEMRVVQSFASRVGNLNFRQKYKGHFCVIGVPLK